MTGPHIPLLEQLPAKPRRIILHWTGGGPRASTYERGRYHYLIQQDHLVVSGVPVAQNMRLIKGTAPYAAHTKDFNSFSVGVSFCGMEGVNSIEEWKAGDHGTAPLTASQVESGLHFVGLLCRTWELAVGATTVFTHAEAQRLHNIAQLGKWDIDVLEFRPNDSPQQIGEWMRKKISAAAAG